MGRVYILGHPVGHSLSPVMHNAAFAALGLPHRCEPLDVAPEALPGAIERLHAEDVVGANVTIPHKETVMRLLDGIDDDARRVGAVNTLVRRGSRLIGSNTDLPGFRRSVAGLLEAKEVLVLGAGGGARACVYALLELGGRVSVANRSADRAERLAREVEVTGRRARVVAWPQPGDIIAADAVVNTTPLGLGGEDPLAGVGLPKIVVDIVPTATETPLVRRAREAQDVVVMDGLPMLLYQGARSFELWTGLPAPLDVMRAALPRAIA